MHTLRRLFVYTPRAAAARWRHPKVLALLLVIIVPGGFALPIVYGLYGAIRHTLAQKAQAGSAAASDPIATEATVAVESETRV